MKQALTKAEAIELVDWQETVFREVIEAANPRWGEYAWAFMPRRQGKRQIVAYSIVDSVMKHLGETLTQDEIEKYNLATDYADLLDYDKEYGGFDEMVKAYVADVPVEDIIA